MAGRGRVVRGWAAGAAVLVPAVLLAAVLLAAVLLAAGCSGTVEASYRPPPEPPPSTAPAPTASPAPVAPPSTPAAVTCGPDDVDLTVGAEETTARGRRLPLVIRPRIPVTCGVANPVRVEVLDAEGRTLPVRIEAAPTSGGTPAATIPADAAVAVDLGWRAEPSSPDIDPATDCVEGRSLRVTLADGALPIPVAAPLTACDGGTLTVGPPEVTPG